MIRIGIIGCGRILNAHLRAYKQLRDLGIDNFRITALCDVREEYMRMFLKRGEGPAPRPPLTNRASGDVLSVPQMFLSDFQSDVEVGLFSDYRNLIASGMVDAVNDFSVVSLHHQIASAAFDSGKHLLTQKPLAITVKAGRQMVEQARASHLTLGVFENVRQIPEVRMAAWAVKAGLIGQPQLAVMGAFGGTWSRDLIVADTSWRHQKMLAGGGVSIDFGVHHIHWLRYVVGDEVKEISGTVRMLEPLRHSRDEDGNVIGEVKADVDDTYLLTLFFNGGTLGQLSYSWALSPDAVNVPGSLVVVGSKGAIRGDEIVYDDGRKLTLSDEFNASISKAERDRFFPLGLQDSFAIQQLDWLRAIEQGTDPETSGAQGLIDLTCAYAMIESSMCGRRVSVEEVFDGKVDAYQREINQHYHLI